MKKQLVMSLVVGVAAVSSPAYSTVTHSIPWDLINSGTGANATTGVIQNVDDSSGNSVTNVGEVGVNVENSQ